MSKLIFTQTLPIGLYSTDNNLYVYCVFMTMYTLYTQNTLYSYTLSFDIHSNTHYIIHCIHFWLFTDNISRVYCVHMYFLTFAQTLVCIVKSVYSVYSDVLMIIYVHCVYMYTYILYTNHYISIYNFDYIPIIYVQYIPNIQYLLVYMYSLTITQTLTVYTTLRAKSSRYQRICIHYMGMIIIILVTINYIHV
jgi:hypothetical protein